MFIFPKDYEKTLGDILAQAQVNIQNVKNTEKHSCRIGKIFLKEGRYASG